MSNTLNMPVLMVFNVVADAFLDKLSFKLLWSYMKVIALCKFPLEQFRIIADGLSAYLI